MLKSIRKRAGAKTSLILLSTFLFLILISSIAFAGPGMLGDVNDDGEVDVQDVVLVMRHVLEIEELDEDMEVWADVNCDGEVDVLDISLIMQYALEIIDEFPCDLPPVTSVKAIDRNTIEVELSAEVAEDVAEDADFYQVTVGNESVDVDDVDYDEDDRIAMLDADMSGKSGVLIVNGVEAEDEVPAEPEFTGISAVEGSRDIMLYFNTEVYEKDELDDDDIEIRVAGEEDVDIEEFDFPESADDAEDEATITVAKRPDANDSVVVHILESGAEKIVNIWDEPLEEDIESTTAQRDDVSPTFDSITVYDDSSFIIAHFSEPVNTSGDDKDVDDGEPIPVGSLDEQVRVTGFRADGSTLPAFGGDGISPVDRDDESDRLRIELNRPVPEGAEITVSFGGAAGELIVDRAKNILAGTYTRTATAIEGPTLRAASVTDLSANSDEQTQIFKVELVGDMDEDEELTINLEEARDEGIVYSSVNAHYDVDGADGRVTSDGEVITFDPDEDLEDGTVIEITAENVDTTGIPMGDIPVEDIEIEFMRSEVGATTTAEFDVLAGLSAVSVEAQYERRDSVEDDNGEPMQKAVVEVLASGQSEHTVFFNFTLEGPLEDGDSVEIDVSELVDSGVTFDDDELYSDEDLELELDNDKIIVTADPDNDEITGSVEVRAEEVDVDLGAAAEELEVVFTRKDSGLKVTEEIDIVDSFINIDVSNIGSQAGQTVYLEFELDGERARGGYMARIDLDNKNAGLLFGDAEAKSVYEGSASITDGGIVTYTAPLGGLDDGTTVVIEVTDVDASGVADDALVLFERRPGGFEAARVMEVD